MRPSRLAWTGSLSLCLALAGCGGRSSLRPGETKESGETNGAAAGGGEGGGTTTSNGTGGSGSTTTSTAGGGGTTMSTSSGGSGGAPAVSCASLVVDGPPLSPPPAAPPWTFAFEPWLVRTEADGSRAALVYTANQPPPKDGFRQNSSLALDDPWGVWPSSLGPSVGHGPFDDFAVGANEGGRYSMLTEHDPDDAMVVWYLDPADNFTSGQVFFEVVPGKPTFVTANGGRCLAGFQRVMAGDTHLLTAARFDPDTVKPFVSAGFTACALDTPLSGETIPFGDVFLAVQSSGRAFGECLTGVLPDGPATRLQVLIAADEVFDSVLTFETDQPDAPIVQAHVTPAQDGAWAAWERVPLQQPSSRHLQLVRLDSSGVPINGNILEVPWGAAGTPFAIASLGPLVAVATIGDPDGLLDIHVLDDHGALISEIALPPAEDFALDSALALLGSPAGDRMLVAWGESSVLDDGARRVKLARVACAAP